MKPISEPFRAGVRRLNAVVCRPVGPWAGLLFAGASALILPATWCVAASPRAEMDLSGSWEVRLDPEDRGVGRGWAGQRFTDRIVLPGSLPERGFGDDPGVDAPWTGGIHHDEWEKPRYAPYRSPDHFKMPFWLQPDKVYVGAAWYARDVDIPEAWAGQRIVLHLERPHWETTVWVDGRRQSTRDSLSTPHEHDLSEVLSPGAHRITVRVDNRMIVAVGQNAHSVTDHTQGNWNGLVGDIELVASPPVWIDDLQVYPNAGERSARVEVRIGNRTGRAGRDALAWEIHGGEDGRWAGTEAVAWDEGGGSHAFTVALGPEARLWDEFAPALHRLEVRLGSAARDVSFGLRDVKVKGTRFTINGRRLFLRGTLECCIFPLTGYPPTDTDAWRRIIRVCKAHGLNHIRFHSWCPPEAAFEAADELGFYFQVECAGWCSAGIGNGQPQDAWFYDEGRRITRAYGNHPSFVMMAYGNEPSGPQRGGKYLAAWCTYWRERDPRRLHTGAAGWPAIPENEYHNIWQPRIQAWGQGLGSRINARPPETRTDYAEHVARAGVPIVSHEIGQWCVYPDFEETAKYTGVLKARNFEIFRDLLEGNHMGDQAKAFLMASGKLQTLCYKEEIESALRTPGFGGFQLLDLHDFPGQGTALVGVLDPFWDSKPYVTPEAFRRFCNSTVPLARMSKRTWARDEVFAADLEIAHFGPAPLDEACPVWKVIDVNGAVAASGDLPGLTVPVDNGTPLGRVELACGSLEAPGEYRLVVGLRDTPYENDWAFWVYGRDLPSPPPGVTVARKLDPDTLAVLAGGGRVLLLADPESVRSEVAIGFSPVFWNTAWTKGQAPHTLGILCDPEHPVFADFPTRYHSDWQWWELIHDSAAMILDGFPPALRPLVQPIDTWFEARRLALLFEARVHGGRLMVCSMDLESDLEHRHAARQMRHAVLQYMHRDRFDPVHALTTDQVASLFAADATE